MTDMTAPGESPEFEREAKRHNDTLLDPGVIPETGFVPIFENPDGVREEFVEDAVQEEADRERATQDGLIPDGENDGTRQDERS